MIPFHRVVPPNRFGRDFVIGDLHGHLSALKEALSARRFIPGRDRLFSVGDLVDRGPDSPGAAELVRENWFHAVRGNHEDMLLRSVRGEGTRISDIWRENGGEWGMNGWIPNAAARAAAVFLEELPYAITLHHKSGLRVGICHAEYPLHDWSMVGQLDASAGKTTRRSPASTSPSTATRWCATRCCWRMPCSSRRAPSSASAAG